MFASDNVVDRFVGRGRGNRVTGLIRAIVVRLFARNSKPFYDLVTVGGGANTVSARTINNIRVKHAIRLITGNVLFELRGKKKFDGCFAR